MGVAGERLHLHEGQITLLILTWRASMSADFSATALTHSDKDDDGQRLPYRAKALMSRLWPTGSNEEADR